MLLINNIYAVRIKLYAFAVRGPHRLERFSFSDNILAYVAAADERTK